MFHKNKMGSDIRSTRTVFNSLLYLNSRQGFDGTKYLCLVISVKMERLPGNTKKSAIRPFVDGHSAISPSLGGRGPTHPLLTTSRKDTNLSIAPNFKYLSSNSGYVIHVYHHPSHCTRKPPFAASWTLLLHRCSGK